MELKIDKKYIDEAVQKAVEEIKQNGILVPDGMTNGEVIQALFPGAEIKEIGGSFDKNKLLGYRIWLGGRPQDFTLDFWNAPYQKGGEE